ncbi:MAG: hypothetical protein JXB32_15545 [Deltaproteobacteria bacterium]|nr:hypothetical protein [Deltaproteobacteria bacterium]
MRRAVWLRVLILAAVVVALAGCEKLMGRNKLVPDRGPLEGNTEVSIYVPDCGDHSKVKEVLFDSVRQPIVSQKDDEVKVRTASSQSEKAAKVTLVLPNQFKCETGALFNYVKMEASTMNYLFEKGVVIGERRVGGYRPDLAGEE